VNKSPKKNCKIIWESEKRNLTKFDKPPQQESKKVKLISWNSKGKRRVPNPFKVGQRVLLKDQTASKWSPSYYGPFEVNRVLSASVIEIKDIASGKLDTVHTDHCKLFRSHEVDLEPVELEFPNPPDDTEKDIVVAPEYYPPEEPEKEITVEVTTDATPKEESSVAPKAEQVTPSTPATAKTTMPGILRTPMKLFKQLLGSSDNDKQPTSQATVNKDATPLPLVKKEPVPITSTQQEVQTIAPQQDPLATPSLTARKRKRRNAEELTLEAGQEFLTGTRKKEVPKKTARKQVTFQKSCIPMPPKKSARSQTTRPNVPTTDTNQWEIAKRTPLPSDDDEDL